MLDDVRLLGKRLVFGYPDAHFLVLHLMIAGRLHWKAAGAKIPGKVGLAAFDFDAGTLVLTEAGSKRRASLHVVRGDEALASMDPGGIDVLDADREAFAAALTRERHTLEAGPHRSAAVQRHRQRVLGRDPARGAALADAPDAPARARRNHAPARGDSGDAARLDRTPASRTGEAFPEKVTAFVDGMAAHGRYGHPCPRCGTPIQRLVYAQNEANYCPTCQTGGKLLADRALSRLLREDWPRSLDDLDEYKAARARR